MGFKQTTLGLVSSELLNNLRGFLGRGAEERLTMLKQEGANEPFLPTHFSGGVKGRDISCRLRSWKLVLLRCEVCCAPGLTERTST